MNLYQEIDDLNDRIAKAQDRVRSDPNDALALDELRRLQDTRADAFDALDRTGG